MVISEYYYNVLKTKAERIAFRNAILARTGMGYNTFYYKLNNDNWKLLELEAIHKIIEEKIYA